MLQSAKYCSDEEESLEEDIDLSMTEEVNINIIGMPVVRFVCKIEGFE